jgi:uncharacterized protein
MRSAPRATARLGVLLLLGAALAGAPARAETPIPAAPTAFVTDRAGLLSAEAVARLDESLAEAERRTGHQVLVYVDHTTGGAPVEDWAVRAFQRWRVGRKGLDDGVVLFVFEADHRLRLEVGYGLEGALPDARAARILDELVAPGLRAGKPDAAIEGGVGAVLGAIGAAPGGGSTDELAPELPGWVVAVGAGLVIFLLVAVAANPSLAVWLLYFLARGRGDGRGGRGGWASGTGGFSGGGGRSGGGGASGSW